MTKKFRAKFPQFAAPAPTALSAEEIAKIGDEFDALQIECDQAIEKVKYHECACTTAQHSDECLDALDEIRSRRFHLSQKYFAAVRAPWFVAIDDLEDERRTTPAEVDSTFNAWKAARAHLDVLLALGSEFYTRREMCDAEAAEEGTEELFDITFDQCPEYANPAKFRRAKRQGKITRHAVTISNGYVKTGKYKMIDGVRVPVVRKAETV